MQEQSTCILSWYLPSYYECHSSNSRSLLYVPSASVTVAVTAFGFASAFSLCL